jgi:hypothetical protein
MTSDDYRNDAEAMLQSILNARSEHLTYEQMDAWAEDEMDQTGRELVVAHIGLCDYCAKQLAAYELYAPVMSGPIAVPAKLIPFRERLRAAFVPKNAGWPQIAMVALAVVVAILAPFVMRNARTTGSGMSAFEAIPPELRQAAQDVVNAKEPLRPAALADFAPNVDPKIEDPASEVVEETQPELRWQPFGASYAVSVTDSNGNAVAQASDLTVTKWTEPVSLNRGATYSWEVRATNTTDSHRGVFRVLGASEEQTLAQLRASGAGPLALGAVAEEFGLLTLAEREFEELKSPDRTKLIHNVNSLLGK